MNTNFTYQQKQQTPKGYRPYGKLGMGKIFT